MNPNDILGTDDDVAAFESALQKLGGPAAIAKKAPSPFARLRQRPRSYRNNNTMSILMHASAALLMSTQEEKLIANMELERAWELLDDTSTTVGGEKRLDYDAFCNCGVAICRENPKFDKFFKPSVFFMLPRDERQTIPVNLLVDLILHTVTMESHRVSLAAYDVDGTNILTESDIELWIKDQLPTIPHLSSLSEEFYLTYVVYATRKFTFFLDKNRVGKIKIISLLTSTIFTEFLELYEENLQPELENSNWFALPFVSRVHRAYVALDKDEDGLLNRQELAALDGGCLSTACLDRIFQECQSFGGKLDYRTYLDVILAREYIDNPVSIQFFFRLLDFEHQGAITIRSLYYFWSSMENHPLMQLQDIPTLEDIQNEIFDMVAPHDPLRITLEDLLKCGKGPVVVRLLTDVNGFVDYENRESLLLQEENDKEN